MPLKEIRLAGITTETVYLPSVIEEAIGAVANLVGDKPVAVIAESPAHLPATVGCSEPLVQVITSLIAHTIKVTDREQVRVQAELLPADGTTPGAGFAYEGMPALEERGIWAVVTVSDVEDQVKLPTLEIHDELFEMSDMEEPDAEGLTLTSCKSIIEGFGGYFWAEGQAGVGSRLRMALQLQAAGATTTDVSFLRRAVDTRLDEDIQFTKTLLLLVEDLGLQDLLSKDLTEAGYRVVITPNGGDVLPLAINEQPDLVLLDLLVRDPLALDVALVLKRDSRTQGIPVLFLTSVDDPQVGTRMGAVDLVVRSVGTGALLTIVNTVLRAGLSPTSRVLVVETDDVLRENMVMMIQAHGYRVTVATGPEEAQVLAERVDPGLILVNAELAQERDYWLLRGLRRISEDSEIFILADALSDKEVKAAISRGATGYSETGKLPDLLNQVREKQGGGQTPEGF